MSQTSKADLIPGRRIRILRPCNDGTTLVKTGTIKEILKTSFTYVPDNTFMPAHVPYDALHTVELVEPDA